MGAIGRFGNASLPPCRPPPRTPITRVTPLAWHWIFGAQNLSECLNSRRATGPWPCKNCRCCGPVPAPGVAELVAAGTWSAGGPRTSPTKFRKSFLRIVGEGLAPPAMPSPEGRSPSAHTACFLFLSVGAHIVRPRAAEVTGPYGVYRTAFCIFVGAGPRPARKPPLSKGGAAKRRGDSISQRASCRARSPSVPSAKASMPQAHKIGNKNS